MKRNWRKAFSLLELLIVMAVVAILAALTVASFQGVDRADRMQQSGSIVMGAIGIARQTAISQNCTTQLWFIQNPADVEAPNAYRGIWVVRVMPDASLQPVIKYQKLPLGIQISTSVTYSSLFNGASATASGTSPVLPGGSQNYHYYALSFDPDGNTSFASTAQCFVTLVPTFPVTPTFPANYITIQIDPVNGIASQYQP